MTAIKHPVLLWGLPVAALIIIFWLSLFCYSAIPVSGADATRALLPGHTPTLPEALVQNLRLPRSPVAVLIGASGARGHAAANPDPQPNGLSFTARH
ncbi:hypothetical protein ECZU06_27790 [Escherichia coli]|nr:hypothetical protein ECZU06_27790 [Escherichia coli]GHL79632.1 hypothetical protein ECZU36_09160 [Escherichia coli]